MLTFKAQSLVKHCTKHHMIIHADGLHGKDASVGRTRQYRICRKLLFATNFSPKKLRFRISVSHSGLRLLLHYSLLPLANECYGPSQLANAGVSTCFSSLGRSDVVK